MANVVVDSGPYPSDHPVEGASVGARTQGGKFAGGHPLYGNAPLCGSDGQWWLANPSQPANWYDAAAYDLYTAGADFNGQRYFLPPVGAEMVPNGNFASSDITGWTATNSGTVAWVGGELQYTSSATAGQIRFNLATVAGTLYRLTITTRRGTASGALTPALQTAAGANYSPTGSNNNTVNTTTTLYVIATAASSNIAVGVSTSAAGQTAFVTSVSLVPVDVVKVNGKYPKRAATFAEWITFTTASTTTRTYVASDGTTKNDLAANTPRFTYRNGKSQLRIEDTRTNVFLQSATGATQNITLTAQIYTLSFLGTGSVTLSGTATGTLNGTGANNRVQLSFTPTAGAVTFTVTGDVRQVNVEAGAFASNWIPTTTTSATRFNETAQFTGFVNGLLGRSAGTVVVRGQLTNTLNTVGHRIIGIGATNHALLYVTAAGLPASFNGTTTLTGAWGAGGASTLPFGAVLAFDATGRTLTGGGAVVSDTSTFADRTASYLARDGSNGAGTMGDGFYDAIFISPERIANANLPALAVAA